MKLKYENLKSNTGDVCIGYCLKRCIINISDIFRPHLATELYITKFTHPPIRTEHLCTFMRTNLDEMGI